MTCVADADAPTWWCLPPWNQPTPAGADRSFVTFILEPLYKIFSHVLGEETEQIQQTLEQLGLRLKPRYFKMDTKVLLRVALSSFFGEVNGFVDMCTLHLPHPAAAAQRKVKFLFSFLSVRSLTGVHCRLGRAELHGPA